MNKIAIIGGGISGISSAYFLHKKYDITLFEKNNYIGGHANTSVINYSGKKIAVDSGFIVYNFETYPNLKPFFEEIKAPIEKSQMSFGITIKNGLEYSGQSLSSLFAQKKNIFSPQFLKMLFDIIKFNKAATKLIEEQKSNADTLDQFINSLNLGDYFKKYYLLPMAAAIWSCPMELMKNYPAQTFLQFFYNHGLLTINDQPQWYTLKGGSKEYVKRATKDFQDNIKSGCAVKSISQNEDRSFTLIDKNNQKYQFDKIIFACHADEVLQILVDAKKEEKAILGNFKYSKNTAILHRDFSQMPKNRKAWASWVYLSADQEDKVSLTYFMNNLQNIDKDFPLFVTLNPISKINEELIFAKFNYTHPIFDLKAIKAQEDFHQIQGKRGIYFCGAHLKYGFHEDGIKSALDIANKLGVKANWQ